MFEAQRISPFNDDLSVFANEVVVAKNEERSRVGLAHSW